MSYRKKHIKTKIYKLKKPKKLILKRPAFWIAFLFVVIIFFILYIFIFLSNFQVENIIVSGNERIQAEDIKDFVFANMGIKVISVRSWKIESRSIFLINTKKINKEIFKNFSAIESVKINKKMPRSLSIEITERKPLGVFCSSFSAEECFLIDQNGIIFELSLKNYNNMPILKNSLDFKQIFVGEKVVTENIISVILKIKNSLEQNLKINIEEVVISGPLRLNIKTEESWQIYFNLESDIDAQILRMSLLLNSEISEEARKNLKYIDLRFKDKAYYK